MAGRYNDLGAVLQATGNLEMAKEMHEKALKIKIVCHDTENHSDVATSYQNLGNICLALKQLDQAQEHYVKAKQINRQFFEDKYDQFFDDKIKQCGSVGLIAGK